MVYEMCNIIMHNNTCGSQIIGCKESCRLIYDEDVNLIKNICTITVEKQKIKFTRLCNKNTDYGQHR
jgi:hypothetical protein